MPVLLLCVVVVCMVVDGVGCVGALLLFVLFVGVDVVGDDGVVYVRICVDVRIVVVVVVIACCWC